MDVVMKLFAVSLVSAVSASAVSAWKWSVALCGAMAVLVWVTRPYMQPQVSTLQSLSCLSLAATSVAFIYQMPNLARAALLTPLLLVLLQVRCPDCEEALAERCYEDLVAELPKLQRGEPHQLNVQLLRF
ncbi:LRR receptor-like serine/threonine-protein kinase FLS2 [Durusdinium trenchii]